MKTITIAIIMLVVGFGLAYMVFSPKSNGQSDEITSTAQQYTCGMHPEIISDEPGYCPLCSMKLTPKKDGSSSAGTITIDPTTTQNMGIVTSVVSNQPLIKKVRAFGKVDYSEPNIHKVNVKIEGWVEKLYIDQTGDEVLSNQPLLEIYSPKLVAAQKEYLIAYKQTQNNPTENMSNLLAAARERLSNWDISEDQIDQLISKNEINRTMTIRSPANGVVVIKSISDGEHLKPGKQLYQIADLSSVWIKASIYEQDLPFISLGQKANINFPNLPDENHTAKISYISPFLDSKRQVEIRLDMNNPKNLLRPEMYAEITINSELEKNRMVIPRSAVINSGQKQLVYVAESNGSYSPRIITTGAIGDNDLIEVASGLESAEMVVTSGQFMLDSESRLNEALSEGHQMGHDHIAHESSADDDFDPDELVATGGHDIHTCPMPEHYNVLQYGAGDCSECGMKLVPLDQTENKKVYVCPMSECGTVMDHKDSCPVCGMNLVRYQPEESDD